MYHVTSWADLKDVQIGEAFTLRPGRNNAQGEGVYFSETVPRIEAADSARSDPQAIVEIFAEDTNNDDSWYKSKGELVEKYQKERSWHTKGKQMRLIVLSKNKLQIDNHTLPIIHCAWRWISEDEIVKDDLVKNQ